MSAATLSFQSIPWCSWETEERPRTERRHARDVSAASVDDEIVVEEPGSSARVSRLTSEGIIGTAESLDRIAVAAVEDDQVDDGYPTVPSSYALSLAKSLVQAAGRHIDFDPPAGTASADVGGGIRLTWIQHDREVLMVVPGSLQGRGYSYRCWASGSDVTDVQSADALAALLTWLVRE